jgi:photosystem II stability/assembly factor-like uncharacterized protein
MADTTIVYVGTVGQSIWRSDDGGLTFRRSSLGVASECDVRALILDPRDPQVLHLGTETGLFVSRDGAQRWERVKGPMDGSVIWSLARDPRNADVLYGGASPPALYRSDDNGRTWELLPCPMPAECHGGAPLMPRVTCILVDPVDGAIFAGIEIAGVRRSLDGGKTWDILGKGLSSQDIHGLASVWDGNGRTLLATTNNDVNRSEDDGESWTPLEVKNVFPWPYCRACGVPSDDPQAVWVGTGNGPPGNAGALYRTGDLGDSWERLGLPETSNSTIWNIAFNASDPRRVYVTSISGRVYRTLDGGDAWTKLPMEFGEIRALAWTPGHDTEPRP